MLSDVRTLDYLLQPLQASNPAWPLEPSLVPGDLRSLPRLKDTAAAFPFVGSTSSKAKHVSKRHRDTHTDTETHTQRILTQVVTDCHSQGAAINSTHTGCHQQDPHHMSTDRHIPSSSGTGRDRRSLVQALTHTDQVHKHMHICGSLQSSTAPLSPQHLCPDPGPLTSPTVTYSPAGAA